MNKEKINRMIEVLEAMKENEGIEFEAKVLDAPELWEKIIPDTVNLLFKTTNGQFFYIEQLRIIPKEEVK